MSEACFICDRVAPPGLKYRCLESGRCELVSIARCRTCGHESELIARRERLRVLLSLMNDVRMRRCVAHREDGDAHFAAAEWARWSPRVKAVKDALEVVVYE